MTPRPALVVVPLALAVFVLSAIVPAVYWDGGLMEIEATRWHSTRFARLVSACSYP
jgi:hypothetical protein